MMFSRILATLSLSLALTFSIVGFANAYSGGNHGYQAPELDPAALGSGLAVLAGGILLVAERRRAR